MIEFLFNKTPLYFMIQSFWRDEAFSYFLARLDLIKIIKTTAYDFNPPLYYILLHFWMKFFGIKEVALRSLSLFFFAINIYYVFLFLHNILEIKRKTVWLYFLLFAFNPLLLYFAFEARMYSLFALLATAGFYYFWRKEKFKYIIVTILGLYTHYFFLFVVFTQFIYLIISEKEKSLKKIKYIFAPLLFFLPWLLYIYPIFTKKISQFWIDKLGAVDIISTLGFLFTGYERLYKFYDFQTIAISIFFILLIFYFLFFNKNKKRGNHLLKFLFLWSFLFYFITAAISIFKPIFLVRYLIFSAVGFNLLLFYIIEHSSKKIRFFLIIILFLIIINYSNLEAKEKRKGNIRKTINEIKILTKSDDLLLVTDPSMFFTAVYYFDENRVYIYGDKAKQIPYYIGEILILKEKIINELPFYPQKAFILEDDNNYKIQANF